MSLELLTVGVGDAFSLRHYGTSFLVRRDDFILAVDSPGSYLRALHEHAFEHDGHTLTVEDIDALYLTHLHGDHVNGLEMTLAYLKWKCQKKLDIYTSPDVSDILWDRRLGCALGQTWNGESYEPLHPDDYYELHTVPYETPVDIGPFELTTRKTVHHLPTASLRITDGETTIGHSCDTAFDPDLVEWLAESDFFLHETSYGPGHTPLFKLLELDEEIRQKMMVVHYPDDLDISEVDEVEFAEQGRVYEVG